jgi:hypothetical protein
MTHRDSLMRFAGCWCFPTDRRTTERISGHRYAFTVLEPDPGHSGSTITVIDTVSVDSAREPI